MWIWLVKTVLPFAIGWASKLLGINQPADPAAAERATGEKLGQAETERDNAVAGLMEVQKAAAAQPDPAPAGGLRDGSDPAAKPYTAGPD